MPRLSVWKAPQPHDGSLPIQHRTERPGQDDPPDIHMMQPVHQNPEPGSGRLSPRHGVRCVVHRRVHGNHAQRGIDWDLAQLKQRPRSKGQHIDQQHVGLEVVQHLSILVHLGQQPTPVPAPVAVEQPRFMLPHEGCVNSRNGRGRDEFCPRQADAGFVVAAGEPDDFVAAGDKGLGDGLHWVAVAGWEVGMEEHLHLATWVGLLHCEERKVVSF
ncbi:unnamed protein product [Clonostachys rosea]|uniref:Uncharacterized protein n=1 Tax=Bionectria ochroleuca TaxID=29856 RepID=A0ABY6U345_BIOOC|nr:unnamed protein product [Clonostachys rosea]